VIDRHILIELNVEYCDAIPNFTACDSQDFRGFRLIPIRRLKDASKQETLHHFDGFRVQVDRTSLKVGLNKWPQVRSGQPVVPRSGRGGGISHRASPA